MASLRRLPILTATLYCGVALWSLQGAAAQTLPSGGTVAAGTAHIAAPAKGNLTVQQSSQRAVVNWQNFNVGAGNSVTFQQPGANAAILNRVTGSGATSVAGSVTANGKVYVVNPNGIQITPTGNVDAKGGFVASTLGIANQDFMAGKDKFTGNGASKNVTNQGSITTDAGGTVALIGGSVANEGTITAPLGKVALGAGEAATLDLNGDGFLQVAVPSNATDASGKPLVSNTGKIEAAGGTVEMKAAAVASAMRDAVNMSGSIQAQSVSGHDGQVTLGADAGTATVSGTIDVSGLAQGGRIDVTGGAVQLQGASLNASGGTQGGLVRIGGQFQGGKTQDPASAQAQKYVTRFGATPALANADTTSVDAATSIKAGASAGVGGTVVIWSNKNTSELGTIDVRGMTAGGAVEVSSKNAVQSVALSTVFTGQGGSLLLDPKNIDIYDDPGDGSITFDDGTKSYAFADDPNGTGTLTLSTQDIMSTLSAGTSLTLQASNDITWTSGGAAALSNSGPIGHLTLQAGRSVIFNVGSQLTFLDGDVTIIANDTAADGVISADRDPGAANISMIGVSQQTSQQTDTDAMINGGYDFTPLAASSFLTVKLLDGAGNTNNTIGAVTITTATFSDVTLSAAPGGYLQFLDPTFEVRNLTVTGNLQAISIAGLGLIGDNTATWTNPFTSTATFLNTDPTDNPNTHSVSFDLESTNNNQDLIGRVTDPGDAVRLDLVDPTNYTAVYGDALPQGNSQLSVAIDPNSPLQSFFAGDTATSIFSSHPFSMNWSVPSSTPPVGTYSGSAGFGGSPVRGSAHGGYLIDDTSYFNTPHTLTITPRPVTVTANGQFGYTYGQMPDNDAAVTLSQDDGASVVGVLPGDALAVVPVVSFSGRTGSQDMVDISGTTGNPGDYAFGVAAPGGTHTYTVTGFDGSAGANYMINTATSTASNNVLISPARLIPTLSAGNYTYGSPDPLVTLSGVINGDTVAPQATITGVTGGQTMSDTGGGNYAFDAHVAAGSRTYTLTGLSGVDAGNYVLDTSTTYSAALNIAPKAISFTNCCSTVTSTYGTLAAPDLSLTGVLSGDDVSAAVSVTGGSGAVTLAARTPVGNYTVSPAGLGGAQAGNYTISGGNDFTLTIGPLALNYTAPSGTTTYGTAFMGQVGILGVLSGDDVSAALGIKKSGVTNLYDNHADAGTYQTLPVLSGAQAGNYSLSGTPGSLVINQLALDFVLHDETINYGSGNLPAVDLTGILFGDDVSATVGTNAPGGLSITTNVGNYGASVTGLTGAKANDYALGSGNNGTITINPKPLGISSSGSTTVYGSVTAPNSIVSFNGLVTTGDAIAIHPQLTITDALGNVVTPAGTNTGNLGQTIATLAANLDAGSYSVAVALTSNDSSHPASNYSLASNTAQSITVNKAPLTAIINDAPANWAYGSAAQIGLNVGFTGFASGEFGIGRLSLTDGQGNVIALGDPGINAAGGIVAAGLDVGQYTATVTSFQPQGGAKLSNYTITSSNSVTETIAPKPLTWTIANATSTYGTLASPSGTLHGIFGGDDVSISGYSATDSNNQTVALTATLMGTSSYTVSAASLGGAKAFDYSLAGGGNVSGSLTVNPKTLTWSISNTSDTYGAARPLNDMGTVSLTGLLPGDSVGATTDYFGPNGTPLNPGSPVAIGMSTNAGTYQMFVTAITGSNAMLHDYKIDPNAANTPGILTINPEPIIATIQNVSQQYGTVFDSASATMAVTGGVLYNGDQLQVIAIFPTGTVTDVGDYTLTGAAHINSNYAVTVVNGTLTVTPLQLKYSTPDATWVYGSQNDTIANYAPTVTFEKDSDSSVIDLIQSDYSTSVLRAGTIPTTLSARSDAASYSLVATLNNPDYTLISADSHPGTLTITPRTVFLLPTTSVYGSLPDFAIGNVVAGDSLTLVSVTATGTTGQNWLPGIIWNADGSFRGNPNPLPVDTYTITGQLSAFTGTNLFNYVLAPITAGLTVTPKPITITSMATINAVYGYDNVYNPDSTSPVITLGDFDPVSDRILFPGQVTYSGLVEAGDANQIAPYTLGFQTIASGGGTHTWSMEGISILGQKGGGDCSQVGCTNRNYTLTNGGSASATVIVAPQMVTYSVGSASTVYGTTTTVPVIISGLHDPMSPYIANLGFSALTGGAPILGAYQPNNIFSLITTYSDATPYDPLIPTDNPPKLASGSVLYNVTVGNQATGGTTTLDLFGFSGQAAANYTFSRVGTSTGTLTVTPKPLTYTTASATAYSGVGAIAGSLDDLGDYTLSGLLPGDQVGVILALDAGEAAKSHNAIEFFPLSEAASVTPGDYGVVVTGLNGPQASDYSVAKTGNTPGTLTAVDVFGDLNGLSFLGSSNAGTNVLNATDALKAEARNAGVLITPTTSVDLTAMTNQFTGYVVPPSSGTLASMDVNSITQDTVTLANYLTVPSATPAAPTGTPDLFGGLGLGTGSTDFTTTADTSTQTTAGCSGGPNCTAGESITGGASATACAAGGAVCSDGSASYNVTNTVQPTGVSLNDSVTAGVTNTATENCGAGTCTQTAHVDVSVGTSVSGGAMLTSNSVDMTEGATATAGVTFNASNGISGEYGSVDSQVGTTIGGIGASAGASASFTNGTLNLGISFSIDVGIGLDVNLNFGINVDAIGSALDDAFNGTNTTYTYLADPYAAALREQQAVTFVQKAQDVAEEENTFVQDVLAGKYNSDPGMIAFMSQDFKTEQTQMMNDSSAAGFSMSRNSDGSFGIRDRTPPAVTSQTVHSNGILDDLASIGI